MERRKNAQACEIVLYQPDSTLTLEVKLQNETVWLNRLQMAQLFGRDVKTIGKHITNALHEELNPTVAKFATLPPTSMIMNHPIPRCANPLCPTHSSGT